MVLVQKAGEKGMKLFWDPDYYCNGQCIYCFTNATSEKCGISERRLDKIFDFFDLIDAKEISIGGGEPFLNDFLKICKGISEGVSISVTTNGTICNEEIIETLIEHKIKVTISLDSLQPDYYKKIRRGLDLNVIVNTIQKLSSVYEIRPNLSLRVTINKNNYEELDNLIEFCVENKIPRLKVNTTNLFGRAKSNAGIILNFDLFQNKLTEIEKYVENYNDELSVELPIKKYLDNSTQKCTLGKNSLYLDPYGNVYPCAFSEKQLCLGNIYLEDTTEVMVNIKKFTHDNYICQNCPIHRYENNTNKVVLVEGQ